MHSVQVISPPKKMTRLYFWLKYKGPPIFVKIKAYKIAGIEGNSLIGPYLINVWRKRKRS